MQPGGPESARNPRQKQALKHVLGTDPAVVPRHELPHWDDLQLMVAQMASKPLADDADVSTELVIGPEARKPLTLSMPLFVSDMSFGALSEEAKIALARGAELAGTGICSGEGGMLPEEQQENSRYFYELASAMFGYSEEHLKKVQAFHFKGGQGAKTGTGGHLPGNKNTGKISEVRNIPEGEPANSPPTFDDLRSVEDFQRFASHVREVTGGIPVGFKLSANHIERDVQFALDAGADYIILDGRGGGTGAGRCEAGAENAALFERQAAHCRDRILDRRSAGLAAGAQRDRNGDPRRARRGDTAHAADLHGDPGRASREGGLGRRGPKLLMNSSSSPNFDELMNLFIKN